MKVSNNLRPIFVLLLLAAAVGLFTIDAGAQNPRRTSARPTPTVTPTPPSGEVEIISRAEDQAQPKVFLDPQDVKPVSPQTDESTQRIKELTARIKKLESTRISEYDEKQKRLLLNLDILTRAEQRAEGLRKQLFDMIEKESSVKMRLDQIETDSRPEIINRSATFAGSMKPEEIREFRKRSLDAEKQNLQALLTEIQSTRFNLTSTVQRADALVEKLRLKLEREIDDALSDEPKEQ